MEQRAKAPESAGRFLGLAALTAILAQLATCQSDDILKLGLRMSAKQAKDTFRKHLPEQLGKIHAKVAAHYGPKAPELNTVFPGGRDNVSNAVDDDLDDRLSAVIGLALVAGSWAP